MSTLILVVDDKPDVADLFRQQFRRELRSVRTATTRAAFSKLARLRLVGG